MKKLSLLFMLCVFICSIHSISFACDKRTTHTPRCPPTKVSTILQKCNWYEGIEVVGGFRWEETHVCPTITVPSPRPIHKDPVYIGAGLRLPINERIDFFGYFDRDFVDAPQFQVRTGIAIKPFK